MIPSVEEFAPKFNCMVAEYLSEIVRNVGAAHDCQAGYENLVSKISESWNVETHRPQLVRKHIEVRVAVLRAQLVLGEGAENVEPGTLDRMRVRMNRASSGKARQRLHIG